MRSIVTRKDMTVNCNIKDPTSVMEIEIDLTTSTNVHTSFYISVRECLDYEEMA